jgi:hypothetical protein
MLVEMCSRKREGRGGCSEEEDVLDMRCGGGGMGVVEVGFEVVLVVECALILVKVLWCWNICRC